MQSVFVNVGIVQANVIMSPGRAADGETQNSGRDRSVAGGGAIRVRGWRGEHVIATTGYLEHTERKSVSNPNN